MDNSPNKRSWKDDDVVSELLLSLSPSTPGKKSKVESDYFEGSQTPIPTIFSTVGSTPIVDRPFGDHFFSPTRGIMSPMMTLSQSDSQNVPSSRSTSPPMTLELAWFRLFSGIGQFQLEKSTNLQMVSHSQNASLPQHQKQGLRRRCWTMPLGKWNFLNSGKLIVLH